MDEKDIVDLKDRIDELVRGIENIDQETVSFAKTKKELMDVSRDLHEINEKLKIVIDNSDGVLKEVTKVSIVTTLEKLDNYVENINKENANLIMQTNISIDNFTKTNTEFLKMLKKYLIIFSGGSVLVAIIALIIAFIN